MKIKDVLTINLKEDIKSVIDLQNISEEAILTEIDNYIVTDGLAEQYTKFVSTFTSNIVETGVWISGFYGSGKSYFGKLLGYLLSNRTIAGTSARDRILQRFTGITDSDLTINLIANLRTQYCRVVMFDIAKQPHDKGLAFALFQNFLKSINLPENEHGYFLYHLMTEKGYHQIDDFILSELREDWSKIRPNSSRYIKAIKDIFISTDDHSEIDYSIRMTTILGEMRTFSASRLKEELFKYIQISNDEKIVFLFDEASEAIAQNKFSLLDLEGVSESLSSLGGKIWTIAIAQEKLDDVINNSNVNRAQLTKVTDRFKTKIHLEATEIDEIIRNRLLKKNENAIQELKKHYQINSGKITEHAALSATGITKTDKSDSYLTYYPFYKYQFDLMQNFLFGTKGYASSKVAARGMLITTFDILRRELQDDDLFGVATGWQITRQAQPQPPVRLVNKYDNAEKILKENKSSVSGRRLLETIHFLEEAEVAPTTLPNIVKSFVKEPEDIHKSQSTIAQALADLCEAKVLLVSNNTYRITSDIEQRLLDEMQGFAVQGFVKKKKIVSAYKSSAMIKCLAQCSDNNQPYDFYITTDNDDELTSPSLKQLKIKVKSLYNLSDDRVSEIEALRARHQNDKDLIWTIPDNCSFKEIDKLIDEIERITYLEQKYSNPQSDEGAVVRNFTAARQEKENRLRDLIEYSLKESAVIYLFNIYQLNRDNWNVILPAQQQQVIQNVYTKRLESQLSDSVAAGIIKEANAGRLHSYFHGKDFQFFDTRGTFIGDNLKVTGEILFKMRNTFVDGSTLEKELLNPPTGFAFGTLISTVAALMRAGKIMAKHNGEEKFSWRDDGVSGIFSNIREFRKASFKAIARSLSAQQKNEIVTTLQDLKCEEHIREKIDWNSNDFDLSNAVRELARRFCNKVDDMRKQNKEFDHLFPDIETQKEPLASFTGAVSESNYIGRAEIFLTKKSAYIKSVQAIEKIEKFIRNNLHRLLEYKAFIISVNDELSKAARSNSTISDLSAEFNTLLSQDVVKTFTSIQQIAQKIKDEYFALMQSAAIEMAAKYTLLESDAKALIKEINALPANLNTGPLQKTKTILQFSSQRTHSKVEIDFDVKDKHSHFTYSEMLSFIDLYSAKTIELDILRVSLVREASPESDTGKPEPIGIIRKFESRIPARKLKVSDYKQWLRQELQKVAGFSDDDEVEIS